ncbi:MAG: hypothetical protein ACI4HO_06635 [Ruminococcus sp.]
MAAVIVVETERNIYYLHEVAIQEKEDNTLFKTGTVKNGTSGKASSSHILTLLQKLQSVKNESEDNTEYQSRTSDLDNKYLNAVENNDIETAQKLVDEVAKENGYTIKAYHGTTNRQEKSIIKLYVEEYYNDWNNKIQRRNYDAKKLKHSMMLTDSGKIFPHLCMLQKMFL